MTPHLQKQMMDLAEKFVSEVHEVSKDDVFEFSTDVSIFQAGFQAAIPLVRAECEEEIKELELLNNIEVERLIRETDRSAKLIEALKAISIESCTTEDTMDDRLKLENRVTKRAFLAIKEYEASK